MALLEEIAACRFLIDELARLTDIRRETLRRFTAVRRALPETVGLAAAFWLAAEVTGRVIGIALPTYAWLIAAAVLTAFWSWRVVADDRRVAAALNTPETQLVLATLDRRLAGVRRQLLRCPIPVAYREPTALAAFERYAVAGAASISECVARYDSEHRSPGPAVADTAGGTTAAAANDVPPEAPLAAYNRELSELGLRVTNRRGRIDQLRLKLWRERHRE